MSTKVTWSDIRHETFNNIKRRIMNELYPEFEELGIASKHVNPEKILDNEWLEEKVDSYFKVPIRNRTKPIIEEEILKAYEKMEIGLKKVDGTEMLVTKDQLFEKGDWVKVTAPGEYYDGFKGTIVKVSKWKSYFTIDTGEENFYLGYDKLEKTTPNQGKA